MPRSLAELSCHILALAVELRHYYVPPKQASGSMMARAASARACHVIKQLVQLLLREPRGEGGEAAGARALLQRLRNGGALAVLQLQDLVLNRVCSRGSGGSGVGGGAVRRQRVAACCRKPAEFWPGASAPLL